MNSLSDKKIYVALSGGVDSAVVAALLVEAGYNVTGVYMKNWSDNFGLTDNCPWEQDVEDVKKIAEHLNIPWKVFNFEREYKERVLDYFFGEYKAGRTPNPDIMCNNLIKFDLCAKKAFEEGATHLATGHYARRQNTEGFLWEKEGPLGLFTAIDETKDQGYFLQRLSHDQLLRAIFPLGNFLKKEVRILAKHFNLPNAEKKDSQGICFIGDVDVRDFIKEHLQTKSGNIVDADTGKVVGTHQGLWFYTQGQRHGIAVSSANIPYFVVGKNLETNELLVGKGHNHNLLQKKEIAIENVSTISGVSLQDGQEVWVAIRYREKPIQAKLRIMNEELKKIELIAQDDKTFWAPAAGQGALLYEQDIEKKSIEIITNVQSLKDIFIGKTVRFIRNTKILGGGIIAS